MPADPNWTPAETLTFAPPGSEHIACAVTGGDTLHVIWVAAKTLYHARRVNGAWQAPLKVAAGDQPALAPAPDGTLYCAYTNTFLGVRNIYLSAWSNDKWGASQVISHTPGQSSDPAICAGPDGRVHLAWADDTPGFSVIYYGVSDPKGWTYAPVPNGRGSQPSIAASPNAVYVAWQDRLGSSTRGAYEVLATVKRGTEWELPAVVSDTPELNSILPCIASNANDRCHLLWEEERDEFYVLRHADLWPNGWDAPFDVSDPVADARLGAVISNKLTLFQFVWAEGALLKHRVRSAEPQGAWWETEVACDDCAGMGELATAVSPGGELHVVIVRWVNAGERRLYYLRRKALERNKIYSPVVLG